MKYPKPFVTDRNQTGQKIRQTLGKEFPSSKTETVTIISDSLRGEKNFTRLKVGSDHSPCWMSIELNEVKEYRRQGKSAQRLTQISMQIDKKQLLLLIENLKVVAEQIGE